MEDMHQAPHSHYSLGSSHQVYTSLGHYKRRRAPLAVATSLGLAVVVGFVLATATAGLHGNLTAALRPSLKAVPADNGSATIKLNSQAPARVDPVPAAGSETEAASDLTGLGEHVLLNIDISRAINTINKH
jgi:hypothetical protein